MTTPALPQHVPGPPRKSWFERHLIASICIALGGLLLIAGLFVGGVLLSVRSLMFKAEPTQVALARARANPQVVQRLGTPLRPGWFVSGSIQFSNDTGHADLEVPLIGPRGKAEIHVVAEREFGRWQYKEMLVGSRDSDQVIDLLAQPTAGQH